MLAQSRAKSVPLSLGRFEITGRANIGIPDVHRARDESGHPVAVYLTPCDDAGAPRTAPGARSAFEAVAGIDHPNVLRALDFGRDGGFEYLVTEWVEGATLARMIETHGRLPEANVIRYLAQVGQAIDHTRTGGFAPCRVTPGNVLVRSDGLAKLIPFALPDAAGPGTRDRMAALLKPEFAAEIAADPKAARVPFVDAMFSLGTTLHEALTGSEWVPPVEPVGRKRRRAAPRALGLTDRAERAVRRATDPNVVRRPASCLEFLKLLRTRSAAAGTKKSDARTPAATGTDLRACVRYSLGVGSNCTIHSSVFDLPDAPGSAEVWPLVVQDVSATGIGLLLARRCEPGTELSVEVASDAAGVRRCLPVRVVRVRKDNFGHWTHGCTFLTPLTRAELTAILDGLGRTDGM
ncbi:protein kinase domain-containing protein [Frigoriglobus tundricola]|uniref:Protein kinase domain-containing protein n=1 Tax=Frigoriglobus tundricola TaxID=2774151 RepID=A0A6M5YQQ3_9BACT|nr:PilZ domain-containing protein [Frigoriglobus tundricola]QJW96355.1 hypothetical protein FTUN_3912 [Frigoriglobus tundricola]